MAGCDRCKLPHIFVRGLCPSDDPEAFEKAKEGWRKYEKEILPARRIRGY